MKTPFSDARAFRPHGWPHSVVHKRAVQNLERRLLRWQQFFQRHDVFVTGDGETDNIRVQVYRGNRNDRTLFPLADGTDAGVVIDKAIRTLAALEKEERRQARCKR